LIARLLPVIAGMDIAPVRQVTVDLKDSIIAPTEPVVNPLDKMVFIVEAHYISTESMRQIPYCIEILMGCDS
jgi:hypothetical protein